VGVPGFLDDLRAQLKAGTFRPLPVRERKIPKPGGSGKLRKLGIPTIADRVVQAALKLVLEPIFEADFLPVSYGFRPMRRAHDAIAEIQRFGTKGYQWVLDADIEFEPPPTIPSWPAIRTPARRPDPCHTRSGAQAPARASARSRPRPRLVRMDGCRAQAGVHTTA
jgi:Reverse transcriptase (RNA-dependent DNA polymerase)